MAAGIVGFNHGGWLGFGAFLKQSGRCEYGNPTIFLGFFGEKRVGSFFSLAKNVCKQWVGG